jgi:2-dehydropantoate 2-reductase
MVVGAGAVGCFLGARLALAGNTVTLIGRESMVEAVRGSGLTLEEPDAVRQASNIAAANSIAAALSGDEPYDLALVTVKAYDTDAVAAELAQRPALPPLLTMQNGVGNEEVFAERIGEGRVLSGAIDTPVSLPAPGRVRVHRARYRIGLAPVGRAAPAIPLAEVQALLGGAGFQVERFPDHRGLKWTKLLMNMLANASCAILDSTPAQVMEDPVTAQLEARAWQEALAVIAALGVRPVPLAGYPFPLLLPVARRVPASWLARGLRGFVSGGRGSKMPSLQIALSAGKPSEVNWLNGAVARHARQLHIRAPVNTALTDLLSALSCGDALWEDCRGRPEVLATRAGSLDF